MADNETTTTAATGKGRLKREDYIICVDASMGSGTPDWAWIGDDIEDLSKELSPSVSTFKNIKGQTKVTDEGYDPSISADTFYADTNDKLYPPVKKIADEELTGDDCLTSMLEVWVDQTEGPFDATKQACYIKPQSVGGGTGGVNIPFNIHPMGERIKGTATITDGVIEFTPTANG